MTKRKSGKSEGGHQPTETSFGRAAYISADNERLPAVNWKWLGIIAAATFALVFICYTNTLWYALVFNDNLTLTNAIGDGKSSFLDSLIKPFTQPWVRASYLSDMASYTSNFGWYHLVNIWLHFSSAVALALLVFVVARRTGDAHSDRMRPYLLAGIAGLVYACHPLAVQSVTYLSARYSTLGAANFLFALLFFSLTPFTRGSVRVWCAIATVVCSVMCLGSSEVVLALAPSMVAIFFLLKPSKFTWTEWVTNHTVIAGAPFVATLLIPFYLLTGFAPIAAADTFGLPAMDPAAYFATQAKAFLSYYTRTFVVPFGLSIDPPFSKATGFVDVLAIGGVIALCAVGYAAYRWRSNHLIFLGLMLVLAGFLPHAAIVQPESVADPVVYLSLAGMSLIAAWFICQLWGNKVKSLAPKVVALLVVLSGLSIAHNLDFRTEDGLLAALLRTNQNSELGLAYSAMEKFKKEDFAGAIKQSDEALALNPDLAMALYTKGQSQMKLQHYEEAKQTLVKTVKLAEAQRLPILGGTMFALAETYLALGRLDKTHQLVTDAIKAEPANVRGLYILGCMALKRRDYPEAAVYLQRALQNGVADARLPAARALLGMKDYNEAFTLANAIATANNSAESQLLLGNAALALNDLNTAESALKLAIKGNGESAEGLALLSIVYQRRGDKVLADSYHKDAVKRDPKVFSTLLLPTQSLLPEEKNAVPNAM